MPCSSSSAPISCSSTWASPPEGAGRARGTRRGAGGLRFAAFTTMFCSARVSRPASPRMPEALAASSPALLPKASWTVVRWPTRAVGRSGARRSPSGRRPRRAEALLPAVDPHLRRGSAGPPSTRYASRLDGRLRPVAGALPEAGAAVPAVLVDRMLGRRWFLQARQAVKRSKVCGPLRPQTCVTGLLGSGDRI